MHHSKKERGRGVKFALSLPAVATATEQNTEAQMSLIGDLDLSHPIKEGCHSIVACNIPRNICLGHLENVNNCGLGQ